ncbi:PREDICTED: major facilitator superfamily domain-containing protein 1-like isoform X1 [Priapulus caudatus]|uniref:Lysosomal dipeptide transporter MFSD1 n=1 Tax=Priapulus caudatus TaxID=37621 RepID=A0ABM1DTP6_PRICU|nr:PREDICTED: major facilitator superfamily domain-containing protein 1-like isoform X1 [Priapulus caudatus]
MALLHASKTYYRFVVLFFNCMLTFGSYYCFDMPSVLQTQFTQSPNCSTGNTTEGNTTDCCTDCLGMSPSDYNLLYAIYAWTNAVVVIAAGFFVDKVGNVVGVLLFSLLCLLGSATFALGTTFQGTTTMLPIMLFGRLLFGSGNGSLTIVQNRITAFWFDGKELAMAFGLTLAFSRLGSVLNFLLTESFEERFGLQLTLWAGSVLCGVGFVSALIVSVLDKGGVKQLGLDKKQSSDSKKLRFTDIKYFSLGYWLLAVSIMFFYNGIFPFVADASKFIQDKYDYNEQKADYMVGAVYDVSLLMSPFLGGIIDVVGKRGILAMACALLSIPVFGLLAFSNVYPLAVMLWLGVTYSVAAASMWPSIPLVVGQAYVGTAMGITTSIQMVGIGISNVIVGAILGKNETLSSEETLKRWKYVMIFLLGNTLLCVVTTLLLNINDKRKGGVLNRSRREKRRVDEVRRLHADATSRDASESTASVASDDDDERRALLQPLPSTQGGASVNYTG